MRKLEKTVASRGRNFLLRVESSHEAADYQKYEDIRNAVWGFPDDHLAGTRNLMCENFLAEGGSVFIGAFAEGADGAFSLDGDHLAGFCYGFAGILDKEAGFRNPANFRFYSQYAGVRDEFRTFGLGILMKEFQREIVRDVLGIGITICTYDPLTGVNAYRNVHHFGMAVEEYRVATYGEYGGLLNRSDVPTDRFLMSWALDTPARPDNAPATPLPAGARRVLTVESRRVRGKLGPVDFEVVTGSDPAADAEALLIQIPVDFYRILQETEVEDPEVRRIPVDWRLHTRRVFLALFERGYRVVDFLKSGPERPGDFYLLQK